MNKAPRLIYLLRKSIQDGDSMPVLKRNDFPLRFHFKGDEVSIAVTAKGNLSITKQPLAEMER